MESKINLDFMNFSSVLTCLEVGESGGKCYTVSNIWLGRSDMSSPSIFVLNIILCLMYEVREHNTSFHIIVIISELFNLNLGRCMGLEAI